jgi:iron(III) transport system permease protein
MIVVALPLCATIVYGLIWWRPEEIFTPEVRDAALNSIVSSLVAGLLSTCIAVVLVLFIERTDIPGRTMLRLLALTPLLVPPFIGAIAWSGVFGPTSPVNLVWNKSFGHPLWNFYGADGVIFLLAMHGYPVAYLMVAVTLDRIPRALEQAARISGAGTLRTLRTVTFPLILPAALSAFLLSTVSNLADFGIPSIVGTPERYQTLATLIYRYVQSGTVDNPLQAVSGIGLTMLLAVILVLTLVRHIPQPKLPYVAQLDESEPLHISTRWLIGFLLWAAGAGITLLPLFALLSQSLLAAPGVPLTWSNLTLDSYKEALTNPGTLTGIVTSLMLSLGASFICGFLGLAVGSVTARPKRRSDHLLGSMALLPQSVPGLIIATSWLLLAPWIGLYNSPWLILAAYVTAFLGLVVQTVDAPIRAMPQFLIDAARISGASPIAVLRDIIWRMGTPAATTGAAMVFITAVRELTISALLLAPDTQTLGVVVFSLQQSGSYNAAAALSLIITVIGLLVLRLTTTTMRGR